MIDDLINRKDAIDALRDAENHAFNSFYKGLAKAHKIIADLPSAQPIADVRENVRGEWIEDNSRDKSMMWRCSVCGRIAYYPTIGKRKSYKKHCGYNYCPNCGADMRGEEQ